MATSFPKLLLHEAAKGIVSNPENVSILLAAHAEAVTEGGRKLFGVQVRLEIAEALAEQLESHQLLWIFNQDKRYVDLVAWDDPSLLHKCLHGVYTQLFYVALVQLLKDPSVIMAFRMLGATLVELTYGGTTIRKESDASIVPSSLLPARTDPDQSGLVVFEGAVFNESIAHVVLELLFWLAGARCQVATAVKVVMTSGAPKMIAFAVERTDDGPLYHIPKAFGCGTSCTSKDAAGYELLLSAKLLLGATPYAVSHTEEIRTAKLGLPLYFFRETVYRHLDLDPSQADPQADNGFQDAEQAIYDLIKKEAMLGRSVHYAKTYRQGTTAFNAAQSLVQLE